MPRRTCVRSISLAIAITAAASADVITLPAPLANVVVPGATVVADGITFSDFNYTPIGGTVPEGNMTLQPSGRSIVIQHSPPLTWAGGSADEYILTFHAAVEDPSERITGFHIFLGANTEGPSGRAELDATVAWGPPDQHSDLKALDTATNVDLTGSATIPPQTDVNASMFVEASGRGAGDSAVIHIANISFDLAPASVGGGGAPEPGTVGLTLLGIAVLISAARRRALKKLTHAKAALFVAPVIVFQLWLSPAASAQEHDMSNVRDVLDGRRTILQDDDLYTVQVYLQPGTVAADARQSLTSNSGFAGSPTVYFGGLSTGPSTPAIAAGWFFNQPTQYMLTFLLDGPSWDIRFSNASGHGYVNQSSFTAAGANFGTFSAPLVIPGNFIGAGPEQALLVYPVGGGLNARVVGASDPDNPSATMKLGGEIVISPTLLPLRIAAGDFGGNGWKQLVVLDGNTLKFFQVDPTTLNLSASPAPATLPGNGYKTCTIVAGRFLDAGHDDLAIVGQLDTTTPGISVTFVPMTQIAGGGFSVGAPETKLVEPLTGLDELINVQAQAAPMTAFFAYDNLIYTSNKTSKAKDSTARITIGAFDEASKNFVVQSDSEVSKGLNACIHSFAVGNFDNQAADGSHNPALDIAVYWSDGNCPTPPAKIDHTLEVDIWKVNPNGIDWLGKLPAAVTTTPRQPGEPQAFQAIMFAADLRGRSLRLGEPDKVTITDKLQPDIVLAMPPMHVDWITPLDTGACAGTQGTAPCIIDFTYAPLQTRVANAPPPFTSQFMFASGASHTEEHKNTTSWSVGVKQSFSESVTFGVPNVNAVTVGWSEAFQYAHDSKVAKTYNTYSAVQTSIGVKTGLADFIFFTSQRHNVFYYPVIGKTVCPNSDTCADSEKTQMYVVFSVPDQTVQQGMDATTLEWYQPVQEPGNIFSYPASYGQLAAQVPGGAQQLTTEATFLGTGTATVTQNTTWSGNGSNSRSAGTVNSFAEGLGISASGVGTALEAKVNFNVSVNVNASQSFDSLHTSTQTLTASEGLAFTKPGFNGKINNYANYSFGPYILGSTPFADTFQNLSTESNGQSPVDVSSGGPLYMAYVVELSPDGISPEDAYWRQAYNLPDVGLNHPHRWGYDSSTGTPIFHGLSTNYHSDLGNELFYKMKGFFISRVGDPLESSNLTTANAGDKLELTARVYNFSPIATDARSLVVPADHIWATFWGQEWDGTAKHLTGQAFLIGAARIPRIDGFGPGAQNWVNATIPTPFDTSGYAGKYLVFWVTVFMETKDLKLVPEIPDHGVTVSPSGVIYSDLTQFPTEAYGNNIGLYGSVSPLYIAKPVQPGLQGVESVNGPATVAGFSLPPGGVLLDQKAPISANIVTGSSAARAQVTFYDGDPAKGGKAFGYLSIPHIDANSNYWAPSYYDARSCGQHTIFAVANTGSGQSSNSAKVLVNIDPVATIQTMATYLHSGNQSDTSIKLMAWYLDLASYFFKYNFSNSAYEAAGVLMIELFSETVAAERGKSLTPDNADRLAGLAQQLLGCVAGSGNANTQLPDATLKSLIEKSGIPAPR
jgi:hypothetical protein